MRTEKDIKAREYIKEEIRKEDEWRKDKFIIVFTFLIALISLAVMNVVLMSAR